ncbi:MAG: hypothetical protein AAB221_03140, partial [Bacteroidota bacterium]
DKNDEIKKNNEISDILRDFSSPNLSTGWRGTAHSPRLTTGLKERGSVENGKCGSIRGIGKIVL